MEYDTNDIDTLLDKWYDTKEQIGILEKKLEKYKKYAERIMDNEDKDELSNFNYKLTRRNMSRTTLSKEDMPKDIWNKYARNINYPMYILRKNKEDKK
jgi:hypothetical protein